MEFVIDAQKRLQNLQGMQYKLQDNGQIFGPYSSIDPNCPTLQEPDYSDEESTTPKYRTEMDLKSSFKKTEQEQHEDEYYHLLTQRRHEIRGKLMQSDPKLMQQMIDRMGSLDAKGAGGISGFGALTSTFAKLEEASPKANTKPLERSQRRTRTHESRPVENEECSPERYDDAIIEADRKNQARLGSESNKNNNVDPRRQARPNAATKESPFARQSTKKLRESPPQFPSNPPGNNKDSPVAMQNRHSEPMAGSGGIILKPTLVRGAEFRKDRWSSTTIPTSITPLAAQALLAMIPKDSPEAEIRSMLNQKTSKEERFEKAKDKTMAALDEALKRDSFMSHQTKITPPMPPEEILSQESIDEFDIVCTDKDVAVKSPQIDTGTEKFYTTGVEPSKDDKKGKSVNYNKRTAEARRKNNRSNFHQKSTIFVNEDLLDGTPTTAGNIGAVIQRSFNLAAEGLANISNIANNARKVNNNLMEMDENRQKANSSPFVEKQPSGDLSTEMLGDPNKLGDSWGEIKTPVSVREVASRDPFNFSEAHKNIGKALGSEKTLDSPKIRVADSVGHVLQEFVYGETPAEIPFLIRELDHTDTNPSKDSFKILPAIAEHESEKGSDSSISLKEKTPIASQNKRKKFVVKSPADSLAAQSPIARKSQKSSRKRIPKKKLKPVNIPRNDIALTPNSTPGDSSDILDPEGSPFGKQPSGLTSRKSASSNKQPRFEYKNCLTVQTNDSRAGSEKFRVKRVSKSSHMSERNSSVSSDQSGPGVKKTTRLDTLDSVDNQDRSKLNSSQFGNRGFKRKRTAMEARGDMYKEIIMKRLNSSIGPGQSPGSRKGSLNLAEGQSPAKHSGFGTPNGAGSDNRVNLTVDGAVDEMVSPGTANGPRRMSELVDFTKELISITGIIKGSQLSPGMFMNKTETTIRPPDLRIDAGMGSLELNPSFKKKEYPKKVRMKPKDQPPSPCKPLHPRLQQLSRSQPMKPKKDQHYISKDGALYTEPLNADALTASGKTYHPKSGANYTEESEKKRIKNYTALANANKNRSNVGFFQKQRKFFAKRKQTWETDNTNQKWKPRTSQAKYGGQPNYYDKKVKEVFQSYRYEFGSALDYRAIAHKKWEYHQKELMGQENSESGRNPSDEWLEEMKILDAPKKYESTSGTDLELSWRDTSSGMEGGNDTVTATVYGEQSPRGMPEKVIKIHVRENLSHGGTMVMSRSQTGGEECNLVSPREPISPLRGKQSKANTNVFDGTDSQVVSKRETPTGGIVRNSKRMSQLGAAGITPSRRTSTQKQPRLASNFGNSSLLSNILGRNLGTPLENSTPGISRKNVGSQQGIFNFLGKGQVVNDKGTKSKLLDLNIKLFNLGKGKEGVSSMTINPTANTPQSVDTRRPSPVLMARNKAEKQNPFKRAMREFNEEKLARLRLGDSNPWRQLIKDFREEQAAKRAGGVNPWRDLIREFRENQAAKKMDQANPGESLKDERIAEGETGVGGLEEDAVIGANQFGQAMEVNMGGPSLKDVVELDEESPSLKGSRKSDQQDVKSTLKGSVSSKEIVTSKPLKEKPLVIPGLASTGEIFQQQTRMAETPQRVQANSVPSDKTLNAVGDPNKFTDMVRARAQAQNPKILVSPIGSPTNKASDAPLPKPLMTQQNYPHRAISRKSTVDDAQPSPRSAKKYFTNPPMYGNPWGIVIAGLKPPGAPDKPPSNPWDNVIKTLCLEVPLPNPPQKESTRRQRSPSFEDAKPKYDPTKPQPSITPFDEQGLCDLFPPSTSTPSIDHPGLQNNAATIIQEEDYAMRRFYEMKRLDSGNTPDYSASQSDQDELDREIRRDHKTKGMSNAEWNQIIESKKGNPEGQLGVFTMRGQDLVKQQSRSQNRSRDPAMSEKIWEAQQPTNPVEQLDSWWDIKASHEFPTNDNDDNQMSKMVEDFHTAQGDDHPFKKEIEEFHREQAIQENKELPPDLKAEAKTKRIRERAAFFIQIINDNQSTGSISVDFGAEPGGRAGGPRGSGPGRRDSTDFMAEKKTLLSSPTGDSTRNFKYILEEWREGNGMIASPRREQRGSQRGISVTKSPGSQSNRLKGHSKSPSTFKRNSPTPVSSKSNERPVVHGLFDHLLNTPGIGRKNSEAESDRNKQLENSRDEAGNSGVSSSANGISGMLCL